MRKQEFLDRLRAELAGLPREDLEERLAFYDEMLSDRMEEGLPEEAAVAELGPVEAVVEQILADTPLPKLVREKMRRKGGLRGWEILLLVLGFPLWLPLLIAGFAVLLAVYVTIWAVIVSLWAAELSLAVGALGAVAMGVVLLCRGDGTRGLLCFAGALVLAGLSVFGFYGCKALTKGAAKLTKKIALGIKSLFLRKENAQ